MNPIPRPSSPKKAYFESGSDSSDEWKPTPSFCGSPTQHLGDLLVDSDPLRGPLESNLSNILPSDTIPDKTAAAEKGIPDHLEPGMVDTINDFLALPPMLVERCGTQLQRSASMENPALAQSSSGVRRILSDMDFQRGGISGSTQNMDPNINGGSASYGLESPRRHYELNAIELKAFENMGLEAPGRQLRHSYSMGAVNDKKSSQQALSRRASDMDRRQGPVYDDENGGVSLDPGRGLDDGGLDFGNTNHVQIGQEQLMAFLRSLSVGNRPASQFDQFSPNGVNAASEPMHGNVELAQNAPGLNGLGNNGQNGQNGIGQAGAFQNGLFPNTFTQNFPGQGVQNNFGPNAFGQNVPVQNELHQNNLGSFRQNGTPQNYPTLGLAPGEVIHNAFMHLGQQGVQATVTYTFNPHASPFVTSQMGSNRRLPLGEVQNGAARPQTSLQLLHGDTETAEMGGRFNRPIQRGAEAAFIAGCERWSVMAEAINPVLTKFKAKTRFFVIKSNSELDIFSALKWSIWTSTDYGNRRLDEAFKANYGLGPVLLFFSVNGSGKFSAVAQMASTVDLDAQPGIWSERRWRGRFDIKWLFVKDIPFSHLRHITVVNNENKNVSCSRDTQELTSDAGFQLLDVFNQFRSSTGLIYDSAKGQMLAANHPLRREVGEGSHEKAPPPRFLPNFIDGPAGFSSRNFIAPPGGEIGNAGYNRGDGVSHFGPPSFGPGPGPHQHAATMRHRGSFSGRQVGVIRGRQGSITANTGTQGAVTIAAPPALTRVTEAVTPMGLVPDYVMDLSRNPPVPPGFEVIYGEYAHEYAKLAEQFPEMYHPR